VFAAKRFGVRFGLQGRSRRVRVIERLALSRGAALLVVEYDGRRLLLGQSGDHLSLIASGETPLAPHAGKGEHEQS
jgi:Flagellar biosynthesis protein, FliO